MKGTTIRVALLTTTVDFGGIEKVLLTLFGNMDRQIELVPIVFARTDSKDQSFLNQLGRFGPSPKLVYMNRSRLKYLNPILNMAEAFTLLRAERFDLIHSHGYRADLIALVLARWFGVPAVSTCHGLTPNDARLSLYVRLNVKALQRFDRVIAVSSRLRDDLVERGVSPGRIAVIANAVELVPEAVVQSARCGLRRRLDIGADEFVFGFVGRLSEEKGVLDLLRAVGSSPPAGGAWRLLIVGDGPCRQQLERSVVRIGLDGRVMFVGFQSDATPWYSAMDAFVLPSLTEGTPMALLEAMAHRTPVIATSVGGVPAIVSDGANGLLVPPADAVALSRALRQVATDVELRCRLSKAAYETVRDRYDVGTWAASVRGVYEQALAGA